MTGDWLYDLNLGVILLGTLLIFLLSFTIGYWTGRRVRKESEQDSQINTIQTATLGLLGLPLAFTYLMAAARYETRRGLLVQESNPIGTAYLRAKMLPKPQRTQISGLLRGYVDTRLEFYAAGAGLPEFIPVPC